MRTAGKWQIVECVIIKIVLFGGIGFCSGGARSTAMDNRPGDVAAAVRDAPDAGGNKHELESRSGGETAEI